MSRLPKFKSADEEVEYWETHSPLDHEDLETAESFVGQKRPAKISISLRIRPDVKSGVERIAERLGVPYQTLIHSWITERYYAELNPRESTTGTDEGFVEGFEKLIEQLVERALSRMARSPIRTKAVPRKAPAKAKTSTSKRASVAAKAPSRTIRSWAKPARKKTRN